MKLKLQTTAEWRSLRSVVSLVSVWKQTTHCENQLNEPYTTQEIWRFALAKVAQTSCRKRTTRATLESIRAGSTQLRLTLVKTRVVETTMTRTTIPRSMRAAMRAIVRQAILRSSCQRTISLITRIRVLWESTNFMSSIATVMTRRLGSISTLLIAAKISLTTHR